MAKRLENSQPRESDWLDLPSFKALCFDLAVELYSFNEPIPEYTTRDPGRLEASLASPQQTFDGVLLYPTVYEQAAILFYSLIKNHPFQNGNKRIAVMSLLVSLAFNGLWLTVNPDELYYLALNLSNSLPEEKDQQLSVVAKFVKKYTEDGPYLNEV